MRDELQFKMIESDKFEIATAQVFALDDFCKRIANIELQKKNFAAQVDFFKSEIDRQNKGIEAMENNIKLAQADLDKAYAFLRSVHHEEVISKIDVLVKDQFEEMKKQQQQQAGNPVA